MKKNEVKKVLSILLTGFMVFSVPTSAMASDLDLAAETADEQDAQSDAELDQEPAETADSQELDMEDDSTDAVEEIAEEDSEDQLDLTDDFSAGEQDASNAGEENAETSAVTADVYVTVSNKGVLAKTKDNEPMAHQKVTVKDLNDDGILTYDEALVAAHEEYDQADGYVTTDGQWGMMVTKLWGVDTTNSLYYLNGTALQSNVGDTSLSTVKANDELFASVNQDDINYSDKYASFDAAEKTVKTGEEFTLTLNGALTAGTKALSGIQIGIWKDGGFVAMEGKTTGEDGTVTLSFSEPGTYYVTANGSVLDQIPDYSQQPDENWNYPTKENNCPLMAPVCIVKAEKPVHNHKWSTSWSKDSKAHWHVCTAEGCNVTDKKEMNGYAAHSYVWKITTKATVFAPAKRTQVCSKCGYKGETKNYGKKLTPTLKLNTTKFTLKVKQSTSKVKVTGLANGDSVKSWTSSNKSVAAVNSKGVITAGSKAGTAKITVALKSGKKGYITVTVQKATVKTVKITGVKSALTLTKGKSTTLKPVVSPFTSGEKVTYTSANKNVATVNSKGVITAKKKGTAVITVKSGTKKVTCKVTVK